MKDKEKNRGKIKVPQDPGKVNFKFGSDPMVNEAVCTNPESYLIQK